MIVRLSKNGMVIRKEYWGEIVFLTNPLMRYNSLIRGFYYLKLIFIKKFVIIYI